MTVHPVTPSVVRRARRTTAAALAVALALALPTTAIARRSTGTIAPPGNSAVSQYVEDIPTAKGERPTSTIHPGGGPGRPGGGASVPLSQGAARALNHRGPDGRGAAAVAEATSPLGHGLGGTGGGSSPFATIVKTATGSSGGLGALLPILLIVVAIGGGLIALRRRRTA